ncbi:hypothetical protein Q7C_1146 [Methylophaga frappieri]|uniref:Methyltransferase FkbM domain-containing protein n=1 Tax=Methylophaga frappieri (strain ATCC BAA-2434 / DSM 25690 / JAM7) TaxID=754477 RepID=I1YHA8_METFJ|nr:FkbM family methyltransferase [Methylophaga frappieri]AFJ02301.1 hypothetical protein Q7C_1146 [Methylophaga frappieri]
MFGWLNGLKKTSETPANAAQPTGPFQARFVIVDRQHYVRSQYGVYLRTRWTDATFHFCILGVYGKALSDFLASQCRPFSFIDIGANQGLYSLLAARSACCQQVFAFEPVSDNFQYLNDNLKMNGAASKTLAYQAAITNQQGKMQITLKKGHSGGASLRSQSAPKSRLYESIHSINAANLRSLFRFVERAIIKIDVEGFENTVIDELAKSGVLHRAAAVFYEVDARWSCPEQIRQQLADAGFAHFYPLGKGFHYDVLATREAV